jgi:hypothetical protein
MAGRRVLEKVWLQAAKGFNPATNITPHHGNIKDKKFGVQVSSCRMHLSISFRK